MGTDRAFTSLVPNPRIFAARMYFALQIPSGASTNLRSGRFERSIYKCLRFLQSFRVRFDDQDGGARRKGVIHRRLPVLVIRVVLQDKGTGTKVLPLKRQTMQNTYIRQLAKRRTSSSDWTQAEKTRPCRAEDYMPAAH